MSDISLAYKKRQELRDEIKLFWKEGRTFKEYEHRVNSDLNKTLLAIDELKDFATAVEQDLKELEITVQEAALLQEYQDNIRCDGSQRLLFERVTKFMAARIAEEPVDISHQ